MAQNWRQHADQFRARTREEILVAAKELILEKGITGVTIMDIAKKAGISRVTLYKHFNSIHEIALEIQIRILSEFAANNAPYEAENKTGAERLQVLLDGFSNYFKDHREDMRFIAVFDLAYVKEYPSPELKRKYAEEIASLRMPLESVIRAGIEDGSLRSGQDPRRTGRTIVHSLLGLMQRLATRTDLFEDPFTDEMIVDDFISMIVKSLSK